MAEVTVAGVNEIVFPDLSAWGWEIALYLFLGGLVAGLMILSGAFRLLASKRFEPMAAIADLLGLPLLVIGMLLLFLDLASKSNVWRLYVTFQVGSPMSWGSWILLLTMALLALRFVSQLPGPRPVTVMGISLFQPAPPLPVSGGQGIEEPAEKPANGHSSAIALLERGWKSIHSVACLVRRVDRPLATAGLLLGVGVGVYTGVLLSSIEARPLWNSALLAPLFLMSGLASGAAFLCLFQRKEDHAQLVPVSLSVRAVELVLLLGYALTLSLGTEAARNAAPLLFGGAFGVLFWGMVVFLGLLVPAAVEVAGAVGHTALLLPARLPPVMKLAGGLTLRFVIVYAGLRCFL